MTHAPTAPSLRLLECPVFGDIITVDGLPYGHAERPRMLRGLARAGRVTAIVDDRDVEMLLVRDPRDGGLHRLDCLTPRASRLQRLSAYIDAGPPAEDDEVVASPRLRPAA